VTSSMGQACVNIARGLGSTAALPSFTAGSAASASDIYQACSNAIAEIANWQAANAGTSIRAKVLGS